MIDMIDRDGGHARLLAALDDAHEVTDHVGVTLLGADGGTWALFTGDHVERDGSLHIGGPEGRPIAVMPDSTLAGESWRTLAWRGGHTMHDGSRTERFNLDGAAMTLTWTPATADAGKE